MIQMRVTPNEALKLIRLIPHKRCWEAAQTHWVAGGVAGVTAQSICWLYCWAETGMNSPEAARYAQHAFNQIFNKSYEWFGARMHHDWARKARYKSYDIESELTRRLAAHNQMKKHKAP